MKNNKNVSKTKSKIMIGLFGFLGVLMIVTIAVSNFTSKGTYSVSSYNGYPCTVWGQTYETDTESCTCKTLESGTELAYECVTKCDKVGQTCSVANGTGKYATDCRCYVTSCNTGYHIMDSQCVANTAAPATGTPGASTTCGGKHEFDTEVDCEAANPGFNCSSVHNYQSENLSCHYANGCKTGYRLNSAGKCTEDVTPGCTGDEYDSVQTNCDVAHKEFDQVNCRCGACKTGYRDDGTGKCVTSSTKVVTLKIAEGTASNGSFEVDISTNKIIAYNPTTNCGTWSTVPCTDGNCSTGASAQNSAYSGLKVGAGYPSTGPSVLYCKAGSSIHPGTQTPTPTGGGRTPTPTSTAPSETKSCYVCSAGGKTQYIKATSSANAAAAASELGTITAANCTKTSESNCTGASVSNCYKCNGSKQYVIADGEAAAKTRSGGTTCTIVTMNKCDTTPNSNPKTGTVGIIIAWIVGMGTIIYAMWYYRKSASLN